VTHPLSGVPTRPLAHLGAFFAGFAALALATLGIAAIAP